MRSLEFARSGVFTSGYIYFLIRSYFVTGLELRAAFPQGLKPAIFLLLGGRAEYRPFQNRVMKQLLLGVSAFVS
jgi:hypothetical protein